MNTQLSIHGSHSGAKTSASREMGEMSYNAKEKRHKKWQKNNEMPGQKAEHASGYVNVFSFHVFLLGGARAWAALPHSLAEKV